MVGECGESARSRSPTSHMRGIRAETGVVQTCNHACQESAILLIAKVDKGNALCQEAITECKHTLRRHRTTTQAHRYGDDRIIRRSPPCPWHGDRHRYAQYLANRSPACTPTYATDGDEGRATIRTAQSMAAVMQHSEFLEGESGHGGPVTPHMPMPHPRFTYSWRVHGSAGSSQPSCRKRRVYKQAAIFAANVPDMECAAVGNDRTSVA